LASYPHVPTGYELGLGVAVQSYDGRLFFGVTADAHVAPDVRRLRDYILICFRELCRAAGIKSGGPRAAKTRAAKPPRAKPRVTGRAKPLRAEPALAAPAPVNGTSKMATPPAPEVAPAAPVDQSPSTNGNHEIGAREETREAEPVLV
jgi:hypothetical protein